MGKVRLWQGSGDDVNVKQKSKGKLSHNVHGGEGKGNGQ